MRRVSTALVPALALSFIALATVIAGAQNPGGSPDGKKMKNPVASSPDSIKAGQARRSRRTAGSATAPTRQGQRPDGAGRHAPSNLTDDKWDRGSTDGEIFLVIRDGAGPKFDMKGYKSKMTAPDMWNIVNYLGVSRPSNGSPKAGLRCLHYSGWCSADRVQSRDIGNT